MSQRLDSSYVCYECNPGGFLQPEPGVPWAPATVRQSFRKALWAGILTLGFYFIWYNWTVFREADRHAGLRHHSWLYLAPFALAAGFLVWALNRPDTTDIEGEPTTLVFGILAAACNAGYYWLELSRLNKRHHILNAAVLPTLVIAGAVLRQVAPLGQLVVLIVSVVAYAELHGGMNKWYAAHPPEPARAAAGTPTV